MIDDFIRPPINRCLLLRRGKGLTGKTRAAHPLIDAMCPFEKVEMRHADLHVFFRVMDLNRFAGRTARFPENRSMDARMDILILLS